LGGAQLGFLGALAGLVFGELFSRVHVAKRWMSRCNVLPAGRSDAKLLAQDGDDRACLHLADTGQPQEALLEILAVFRVAPPRAGVAAVVADDRFAERLSSARHVAR